MIKKQLGFTIDQFLEWLLCKYPKRENLLVVPDKEYIKFMSTDHELLLKVYPDKVLATLRGNLIIKLFVISQSELN